MMDCLGGVPIKGEKKGEKARHTMGPWRVGEVFDTRRTRLMSPASLSLLKQDEKGCVYAFFTNRDEGRSRFLVCEVDRRKTLYEEIAIANACLIAAAPEMFEALEMVIEITEKPPEEFKVSDTMDMIFKAAAAIAKAKGEGK